MNQVTTEIISTYGLKKSGSRYAGKCPMCGGSDNTNRFSLNVEKGLFHCFSCNFGGNLITYLRKIKGLGCAEAHEQAGIACNASLCRSRDRCRLGGGQDKPRARRPLPVAPPPPPPEHERPRPARGPLPPWQREMSALVEHNADQLRRHGAFQKFLAARGISMEDAARFKLGWLRDDVWLSRARLAIAAEGKTTLWVPAGLIIPVIEAGVIKRVKIRRTDEARADFAPDLKYYAIKGGSPDPWFIERAGARGLVVVESELDAISCAAAVPDISVIAMGTTKAGLTDAMTRACETAPVVLIALDADGPGAKAAAPLEKRFDRAKYYPVTRGKDVGDIGNAAMIRAWLEAGLPPAVHDDTSFADLVLSRGKGEEQYSAALREWTSLLKGVPVVPYITTDARAMGLICNDDTWRERNPQTMARLRQLLFSDAADQIIATYGEQMRDAARRYHKERPAEGRWS
jgi:DNA primase